MKYIQDHMFPNGEDLPLFSGVAQRGRLRPFAPTMRRGELEQKPLFDLGPAETRREAFFWRCPECEAELHVSWADCPYCEVDSVA